MNSKEGKSHALFALSDNMDQNAKITTPIMEVKEMTFFKKMLLRSVYAVIWAVVGLSMTVQEIGRVMIGKHDGDFGISIEKEELSP